MPVGAVEDIWLEAAAKCASETLGLIPARGGRLATPAECRDPKRDQYLATCVLEKLLTVGRERNLRVLGITEVDLYIPILTFLFGQAQLSGRLALVSLARLRPEFYGFSPDRELTALRLRKEVIHELGHTLGLVHCSDRTCAMCLSNSIVQVDAKNDAYCAGCGEMARAHLRKAYSGGKA